MNKKTLAVCLYGNPESIINVDLIKEKIIEKFNNEFDLFFFQYFTDPQQFVNLKRVSFYKRNQEIDNGELFDVCLAVHADHSSLIDHLFFKEIDTGTLFFVTGIYRSFTMGTGIYPWIYYSHSLIFDRACEFEYNTIPPADRLLEHRFYHHLKTVHIDTECINVNIPELFERIS